jgi:hypothetical protein
MGYFKTIIYLMSFGLATLPFFASEAFADEKPTDLGFSAERPEHISSWIDQRIDTGKERGIQLLIARRGQVEHC